MRPRLSQVTRANQTLAELVEDVTERLQSPDTSTWDEVVSSSGESRAALCELIPVLQLLNELGKATFPAEGDEELETALSRDPAGMQLGDFRIVREIGRGGMGVVYEAQQISLGRRVAVKVLPFASVLDGRQLSRFVNEARAAAALDHPHIVPVYAVGSDREVHYYAMQLIDGLSLADIIARLRPDDAQRLALGSRQRYAEAARLGIQAAEALQHAHELGVVHRDIKPSNLLVASSGHLWVTDFGLARLPDDTNLTRTGDIVGTMRYMAPEQAAGKPAMVDHRSDIYSLGATLYELLTLQPAFDGADRRKLLQQISDQQPRALRKIDGTIPRDLEIIVGKAMAERPEARYGSARELADDLRRYLAHQPILAKPPTVLDRLAKLLRRHAAVVCALLASALLALGILTVSLMLVGRERDSARLFARHAQQAVRTAEHRERQTDRERMRAETNFQQARKAVDQMFVRAADQLSGVAHSDDIRHNLLEDSLAFIEDFLRQKPTDDAVRFDLAVAFDRVAEINRRLGNNVDAEHACQRAQDLFAQLVAGHPSEPMYQVAQAENLRELAQISLARTGSWDRSHALLDKRTSVLTDLVRQFPHEAAYHCQLAMAQIDDARLLSEMGRFEQAEQQLRLSLDTWTHISQQFPCLPDRGRGLATNHHLLGSLCLATCRMQEANEHLMKARARLDPLATAADPTLQHDMAHVEQDLARLFGQAGDPRRALTHLQRALSACEQLVHDFPQAVDYSYRSAACHWELFQLRVLLRQQEAADGALEQSIQHLERIAGETKGVLQHLLELARNHYVRGLRRRAADSPNDAGECCGRARKLLEAGVARFPQAADAHAHLAWLISVCPEHDRQQAARAVELAQRAVELEPERALPWRALGAAQYRSGAWAECVTAFDHARQIAASSDPSDLFLLAMAHQRLGQTDLARHFYQQAVDWLESFRWDTTQLVPLQIEAAELLF